MVGKYNCDRYSRLEKGYSADVWIEPNLGVPLKTIMHFPEGTEEESYFQPLKLKYADIEELVNSENTNEQLKEYISIGWEPPF